MKEAADLQRPVRWTTGVRRWSGTGTPIARHGSSRSRVFPRDVTGEPGEDGVSARPEIRVVVCSTRPTRQDGTDGRRQHEGTRGRERENYLAIASQWNGKYRSDEVRDVSLVSFVHRVSRIS